MENKEFRFDPIEHRYWLGDEEMPGVTKIIAPLNDFSKVPKDVLQAKAQAGTDIHLTAKLWLDGTLDESSLAEGNKIALDLIVGWLYEQGYESDLTSGKFGKLVEWENPTYHEKLKYGTTPDLVFDEAIVELKTRTFKPYVDPVQLIAQAKCFPEWPPKSLWVLFVDIVNRKTTLHKAEDRNAWSMFRKLLEKLRYDQEIEETIRKWKGK